MDTQGTQWIALRQDRHLKHESSHLALRFKGKPTLVLACGPADLSSYLPLPHMACLSSP